MQVSVETISPLERRMKIAVPVDRVEGEFNERLGKTARTVRVDGFRPGKVPLSIVKKRFGESIRQETIGDLIRDCFYEAVSKEQLNLAGYPSIDEVSGEVGKDLEFVALFEVYPQIPELSFTSISVERPVADINESDVDTMIENLRKQRTQWVDVERAAEDGDRVIADYEGFLDGEAFAGGQGANQTLQIGAKRMIPGFEEGLIGLRAGDEKTLALTFPEDYHAEDLKGKAVEFKIKVHKVQAPVLPEINEEFIANFGVSEGGLEKFRADVKRNMERELKQAVKGKVKSQVFEALVNAHEIDVPKALVAGEIERQRENMARQFGGQKLDKSMLPDEIFAEAAKRSVALGLLVSEIVKRDNVKADAGRVRAMIQEIAESYEQPEQVLSWYMSNREQMAQLEAVALEDQVVDLILAQAQVAEKASTYEEVLRSVRG